MKIIYRGSVKNLYVDNNPERLWFEYTDDYSVFDWGKMPDPIPGKGEALARLAEWFFRQLEDPARWKALGLDHLLPDRGGKAIHHHFLERADNRILVNRVDIPKLETTRVGGVLVYDYSFPATPRQLLPLEVIFRFGAPKGSSLLERTQWYPFDIYEGVEFPEPLVEFSTKLESKDRVIPYQEAALILKGDTAKLKEIYTSTHAVAMFLKNLLAEKGLKLWDGKLEWAWANGHLSLVDSIGPDELRVSQGDSVMSKQFLRDFYLGGSWYQAVEKGKKLARDRGLADWKSIVENELGAEPAPLSAPFREAATALYADFVKILVDGQKSTRFVEAVTKL
ncbi:MAG: phosphoribosylaminoimidazole succinocarboxamide synthase [Deltaproteobacteria bacterium]|nr:phosphoribosylaminoimidazole succinocarboxamide synthase [Deltaproteobacteria bacterium]